MNKEINKEFKIVIDNHGIIKKYCHSLEKTFCNKIKKNQNISKIISELNFSLFFETLNSFINDKELERNLFLKIKNKRYNILFTKKSKKLIELTFKKDNNKKISNLDLFSNKLKEKHDQKIYKISKEICSYVSKSIQLTNLFIFNYQNFFSIRYWDITSEYEAHFMDKKDIEFITKLQNYIYYNYLSSEIIDQKLDLLFFDGNYKFFSIDQITDSLIQELSLTTANYIKEIINFCNENNLTEIGIIPISTKSIRVGFVVIFKNNKFTKLEKGIFYDIKQYIENLIQNSKFFKDYLEEIEDVNNLKIKLPGEIFKTLYFSLIKMNKINNIHELKIFSRNELKELTNSDLCSYYEINLNNMSLQPEIIDEEENIKNIIKKEKLSLNDQNIKKIINIKKITFYNSNYEEKGLFIYPGIKEKNSYMFCPLYLTSNNPNGIFILTKKNNKKFNYIELIIVNTFFNHAQKKHKELLLIKENLESKIKYKALYETILNLNMVNSTFNTFDIIAKIASNLVSSETVVLYKIEKEKNNTEKKFLQCIYSNEEIETRIQTLKQKIEIGKYLIGKCCKDGITRFQNIEDYDQELDSCSDKKPKSILAIPLQIRDEIMGGMVLMRYSHLNFDSNDLETILPFAQQAINIVYQNILIQSNIDKQETYKCIIEFLKVANKYNNIKSLFKELINNCFKLSPHSSKCGFFIYHKNRNILTLFYNLEKIKSKIKPKRIIIEIKDDLKEFISKKNIMLITKEDKTFISEKNKNFFDLTKYSFIFIPLHISNKFIGIIYLGKSLTEKNSENEYSKISAFLENIQDLTNYGFIKEKTTRYLKYF